MQLTQETGGNNLTGTEWQETVIRMMNPEVTSWDITSPYMIGGEGLALSNDVDSWNEFREMFRTVDAYNEPVNFYFKVNKKAVPCSACKGSGNHAGMTADLQKLYDYNAVFTSEDLGNLVKAGRIPSASHGRVFFDKEYLNFYRYTNNGKEVITDPISYPPLDEVRIEVFNKETPRKWLGPLDQIEFSDIFRLRRLSKNLPVVCEHCQGVGVIYMGQPKLSLYIWMLHPGHGASRCIQINQVEKIELPLVCQYIAKAQKNIMKRFEKVTNDMENKLQFIKAIV